MAVGHVNKAPSITSSPCSFRVNENAAVGTALTGSPLLAADPDTRDNAGAGDTLTAAATSFAAALSLFQTPNHAGGFNPA